MQRLPPQGGRHFCSSSSVGSRLMHRVIAMGLPSQGLEATFRNPAEEVARFLRTKHGSHFMCGRACVHESCSCVFM